MQFIFYFKNIGVFTESSASLGRATIKINNQKNPYFQFSSQMLTFGSYDTKAENQNR